MTAPWVYIRSEPGLWTVGHYSPSGQWHPDSDHGDREQAARRTAWLNGARSASPAEQDEQAAAWLSQLTDALAAAREAITVPAATEWDDEQDKEERTAVLLVRVGHLRTFLDAVLGRDCDVARQVAHLRERLAATGFVTRDDEAPAGPRGQRVEFSAAEPACGCPVADGMVYHRQDCPDPVVRRLGWHADAPAGTEEQR